MRRHIQLIALFLLVCVLAGCGADTETAPAPAMETPTPSPTPAPPADTRIRISELMIKNHATLRAADGGFYDWIELENRSEEDVSLEGWQLSDRENRDGWSFPACTLAAGQRMIVYASKAQATGGELHADFALSEGETLFLRDRNGQTVCAVPCTGGYADRSLCLAEDGSYTESLYPTPQYENSPQGYDRWQNSLARPSGLVINEVMVENFSVSTGRKDVYCDWVELKNFSDVPIELSDHYLSDDGDAKTLWRLPQKSLAPGKCCVVLCSGGERAGEAPFKLDSTQEQLFLSDSQGNVVDFCSLRDIPYEGSYGRRGSESGWFYFAEPTPGKENGAGWRRVSEAPVSLTADGIFENTDGVTVELSGKGKIYYTTDTTVPTVSSREYTAPIPITDTTILRAVCVEEGALPSRALTLSFLLNEGLSLPAVSLVTDDLPLFNFIYYQKQKDIEVPCSVSFYEEGGGFTLGCGVKMNGMTSLELFKKNMSLRFRGAYGQETLEYDLFGGGVTEFTNLVLRAGQDYYSAIVRNELCQELSLQMGGNAITQRSRYCILYVNGKYFGIYALKEKSNEQLYASLSGTERDSVTVEEAQFPEDSDFYSEVYLWCTSHDMSREENYRVFCERMDVDSLIDWMVIEGYCANDDLTAGNVRYVRSTRNDGKWRLMLYDLDSSFAYPAKNFYNILPKQGMYVPLVSKLISSLLVNGDFRDRFLTRAGYHLNHALTNENAVAVLDALAAEIDAEVARDYGRVQMSKYQWEQNIRALRGFLLDNDWRQHNIDTLCDIFDLSSAEREKYFG